MKKFLLLLSSVFCLLTAYSQNSVDYSVQLTAEVQNNPAQITISIKPDPGATDYTIYRKLKTDNSWSGIYASIGGTSTSFIDTAVSVGVSYEYKFQKSGNVTGYGYINSGIEIPETNFRGKMILIFDTSFSNNYVTECDQLINDLRGDGWMIIRHDVSPFDSVPDIKQIIVDDYNAFPSDVKAVYLVGHVPVPYSGDIAPDGHVPDHKGAWPADVFYADMDGNWTDVFVNDVGASQLRNQNIPGDGKYDQSTIPSDLELQIGRIDFYNMFSFSETENQLIADYLQRAHDYKFKITDFNQRALIDDNFGGFGGEAFGASAWKNFAPLVSADSVSEIDYFSNLSVDSYIWSYGCGGGSPTGCGGVGSTSDFVANDVQTVFTMLFGSYFGDWGYDDDFMRASLASGALSVCWSGRPHWQFHHMGLGENIGYSTRASQNNNFLYYYNYGGRFVHVALLGDPSLHQYIVAPASSFVAVPSGNDMLLSWTASTENNILGYNIYRTTDFDFPFEKMNDQIITANAYTDLCVPAGDYHYMVRAVKLETTPSGSFYNLSQGNFADATSIADFTINILYMPDLSGSTLTIDNNTTNATSHLWDFGDGQTSTDEDPTHTYSSSGIYEVTYIASNDCLSDTAVNNFVITSLDELENDLGVNVYPNPANELCVVSCELCDEESLIEVFDAAGRIIYSTAFTANCILPTANWQAGVYIIRIVNDDSVLMKRVVKM